MSSSARWISTRDRDIGLQTRFEQEQRDKRHARIRYVAATNLDLTLEELGERFGCGPDYLRRILPPGEGQRRWDASVERRNTKAPAGFFSIGWRRKGAHPLPEATHGADETQGVG